MAAKKSGGEDEPFVIREGSVSLKVYSRERTKKGRTYTEALRSAVSIGGT